MTTAWERLETRKPLLEECADALAVCESVNLDDFLGWGRTVKLTNAARAALIEACGEEIKEMARAVETARAELREAYRVEVD
jgi:hypothetical protein